jgi:hypothetical protein
LEGAGLISSIFRVKKSNSNPNLKIKIKFKPKRPKYGRNHGFEFEFCALNLNLNFKTIKTKNYIELINPGGRRRTALHILKKNQINLKLNLFFQHKSFIFAEEFKDLAKLLPSYKEYVFLEK